MSQSVSIDITTDDQDVTRDLIDSDDGRVATGMTTEIDEDTKLVYKGTFIRKSAGIPDIMNFTLETGENLSYALIGNWLYDRLRNKDIVSFQIGGDEVPVDDESIQKTLDRFFEE